MGEFLLFYVKMNQDKVKLARKQYRNQGLYTPDTNTNYSPSENPLSATANDNKAHSANLPLSAEKHFHNQRKYHSIRYP